MHSYGIGGKIFPVPLKGRAWITVDNFQIVRMEAGMVKPMPEIRLLSEHQAVEYGPVPFPKKAVTLWQPKDVEIYFDFRSTDTIATIASITSCCSPSTPMKSATNQPAQ